MSLINTVLGTPLGWVFHFCYQLLGNYGLSILLFTLFVRIVFFPLAVASQINSIKMVKMRPALDDLKERHGGTPKVYMREMKKLYKQEKYNSFIGIAPLLAQIPLILGVINVMYNPLQHLLRLGRGTIDALAEQARALTGAADLGFGAELRILELVQENPGAFAAIADDGVIAAITGFNLRFMGMDLSALPTWNSPLLALVFASGLSAFLMCALQNRYNVLQREQGAAGKWGMTAFLVVFSVYFTFIVPAGIGVFWVAGNLLTIAALFICNLMYDPRKYIDYQSRPAKAPKPTKAEKAAAKQERAAAKAREKADVARFQSAAKQLVFYSEGGGYYKYFKGIIEDVLEHSEITVHYVTSDLHDGVFDIRHPRFETYYVAGNALIAFMMRIDADMVIMTMPDLQKYHIKRSLVRKDVEYAYTDHGMTSLHLTLNEGALDHFDTIFCNGPNHIAEIRAMEKVYGLPPKKLVEVGFCLLDALLESVEGLPEQKNERKKILIAPSWQKDNLLDLCLDETLTPLLGKGYDITLRPHPEYVKRFPGRMNAIRARYGGPEGQGLTIEADFSSNRSVYESDLVITDWSSIAQEFSYATKKPSVFINTPIKVSNPEYKKIPLTALDISLRDEIGVSVDVDKLGTLPSVIARLLDQRAAFKEQITRTLERSIFNIGASGRAAGAYIIQTIEDKNKSKGAVSCSIKS